MKPTLRALRPPVRVQLQQHITEVVQAQAAVYGAGAQVHNERRYPVLVNDDEMNSFARQVALDWFSQVAHGIQH